MLASELASGAPKEEAAAKTAKWTLKNVDRFKLDSVFQVKLEAVASKQPQNLPDNDTPRQAMITPPVDDATGLSIHSKEQLDNIWDFIEEKPPGSATCDGETQEAHEDENDGAETREDKAAWDWQFREVTNNAVEDICARGALRRPICSGSPAVAERTKCESAAVADARCQSPAVAATSLAGGSALAPLPQHQPQHQALPQQLPPLAGPAQPPLKPPPPQPPSELDATPKAGSPSPTPQHQPQQQALPQQPPQLAGLAPPPSELDAKPKDSSPSPTPNQAPPQKQAPPSKPEPTPSSLNDAPLTPMPTRTPNVSPPKATAIPATVPAGPPLQVSDPPRLDRSAVATSPDEKFRSAVATSALQRGSSPSARSHISCYYDSVDSFEPFDEGPRQMTPFNVQHAGSTRTSGNADWKEPARDNCVGNFALQLYNMGTRSDPNSNNDSAKKQATRRSMDDHLKKNAAQISVCLECNLAVEELLRAPAARGADDPILTASRGVRLADRPSWEHHVCILEYNGHSHDTMMIAARKRSFSALDVLYSDNMNEKPGQANTRLLICKATFHQRIPRIGDEIIIFAVHGHHETMKKPWTEGYKYFWTTVKWAIETFKPDFFMGDFNMALLLVPSELSCRGLECDVLAYYPWRFTDSSSSSLSQTVGLDSCGIFWVRGGDVESRLNWPASHIQRLLSAGTSCGVVKSDWGVELHSYEQSSRAPGQPWWNYKCAASKTEKASDKNLETMLQDFLSCRMSQEEWNMVREDKNEPVGWIRFRQKQMPKEAVFVNGAFHCGAHMNLMVWTDNPTGLRSQDGKERQKQAKKAKREKMLSRPWSQSRPRWYESDSKDARHQWSGHQWNNDRWGHHSW